MIFNEIAPKKRIIIIGNADETISISHLVDDNDLVVRFNKPNPSCNLKANLLFVANGAGIVVHKTRMFNDMMHPNCPIIWRYTLKDILTDRYEENSLSRKLRYLILFPWFKKINHFTGRKQSYINDTLQCQCTELVKGSVPSTGFLAIYLLKHYFSSTPIYIHNFTFKGWSGHNWNQEDYFVQQWINEGGLFPSSSLTHNQG